MKVVKIEEGFIDREKFYELCENLKRNDIDLPFSLKEIEQHSNHWKTAIIEKEGSGMSIFSKDSHLAYIDFEKNYIETGGKKFSVEEGYKVIIGGEAKKGENSKKLYLVIVPPDGKSYKVTTDKKVEIPKATCYIKFNKGYLEVTKLGGEITLYPPPTEIYAGIALGITAMFH